MGEWGTPLRAGKGRPSPSHPSPPLSALPWLPGLLPALLHISLGHQGGSEDSSGALESSEGARKSDTLF